MSITNMLKTDVQIAWPLWVRPFNCLAQVHSNNNAGRCRESAPSIRNRRFYPLRCDIEVAYIFASIKAITVKFIFWENMKRKEL